MIAPRRDVSRETLDDFGPFCELLRKWTSRINLIAASTVDDILVRHVEDSLRVMPHIPLDSGTIVDLGSGAGFPGLVVGRALASAGWRGQLVLVEADARKCAFLAEAARLLNISPTILNTRIELAQPLAADVIMARALASLDVLLSHFMRHARASAIGLFLKGETAPDEVERARAAGWTFDLQAFPDGRTRSNTLVVRNVRVE